MQRAPKTLGIRAPKDVRRRRWWSDSPITRISRARQHGAFPRAEGGRPGLPAFAPAPRPDNEDDPECGFLRVYARRGTLRLAGARSNAMTRAPPPAGLYDADARSNYSAAMLALSLSPRRKAAIERRDGRAGRAKPGPPLFLLRFAPHLRFPYGWREPPAKQRCRWEAAEPRRIVFGYPCLNILRRVPTSEEDWRECWHLSIRREFQIGGSLNFLIFFTNEFE